MCCVSPRLLSCHCHRRDRIRHKVETLLQQQAAGGQQQQRRHFAQTRQQAAVRSAALRQQQLAAKQSELQAQRQLLLARCEGVVQAAGGVYVCALSLFNKDTVFSQY